MDTVCRLCAEQSDSLVSVFSFYNDRLITDLIAIICPIKIEPREELPQNVCEQCLNVIVSANNLRETSVRSDLNFRLGNIVPLAAAEERSSLSVLKDVKLESQELLAEDPLASTLNTGAVYEQLEEEAEELLQVIAVETKNVTENSSRPKRSGSFPCPHGCGQSLAHSNNIRRHVLRKHKEHLNTVIERKLRTQILFQCDLCGLRLKSKFSITLHMKRHHLKDLRACSNDESQDSFKKFEKMQKQSTKDSQELLFPCNICERKFTFSANMYRHRIRLHSPNLPFACPICPDRFFTDRVLKKHIEKHDLELPKTSNTAQGVEVDCKLDCKFCGKNFRGFKQRLELHLLKEHFNELSKVLECEICQKKFVSSQTHRVHMETHKKKVRMQNYPNSCQRCGKRFVSEENLQKHMQSHSIGHFCHICGRSMSSSTSLEYHIRRHQVTY